MSEDNYNLSVVRDEDSLVYFVRSPTVYNEGITDTAPKHVTTALKRIGYVAKKILRSGFKMNRLEATISKGE